MTLQVLKPKVSIDTVLYRFDFSSLLQPGEYLIQTAGPPASPDKGLVIWSGADDSSSPLVVTAALAAGPNPTVVELTVSGGLAGNIYKLAAFASTSANRRYSVAGYVPVVNESI